MQAFSLSVLSFSFKSLNAARDPSDHTLEVQHTSWGGRDPEADGEKNTAPKLPLGVDKEPLISKERYNIEQERVFIIPDTNILLKQFLSHGQAAGEVSAK